jgi:hypothetical protein
VELCEGLVEIGECSIEWCDHSIKSTSPPHSGGFVTMPSIILFGLVLYSMMALKALEMAYFLTASSPTLESHPSLQ